MICSMIYQGLSRDDVVIYNPTNGAAYTGLSTGNPAAPFTYQYSYWGNNKNVVAAIKDVSCEPGCAGFFAAHPGTTGR